MEEILLKYQKSINSILEEDRNIRRKGLEDIKSLFISLKDTNLLIALFEQHVFKNIVRALDDKVEKHREITIIIIEKYLSFEG